MVNPEPSHTIDNVRAAGEGENGVARILWVGPYRGEWWVTRDGAPGAEAMFDAREPAIDWACRVARLRAPCLVRVQDHAGSVRAQFAFEDSSRTTEMA